MTRKQKRIGFDRFIKLEWLEETARLVDKGHTTPDINSWLENSLENQIQGKDSRRKTRNVLTGVWSGVPVDIIPFRDDGLKLLKKLKPKEILAVHWCMSIAAYPFFAFVTRQIGRLNKLQTEISSNQIQRRVVEHYGDTQSIHRAVARLIQSLCDWNVLESKNKSLYNAIPSISTKDSSLLSWAIEAVFYAQSSSCLPFQQIINDPCWFPFSFDIKTNDIRENPRLELFRQGLDEDFILLKK
ncbi:hypothetical protein QUF70_04955 [Desulfobacterales bacterium HSG17]|nr:hypothetical protein [Desulfobacterales bacterium HSG17]